MQGIKIEKIKPVVKDERGETYELFKGKDGKQVSLFIRKAGQFFADHFHKGDDPSKNPELFYLISGRVKLTAWNGRTNEKEEFELSAGEAVSIEPYVYHSFTALEDATFIEYRSTIFDSTKDDCYTKEEYEEFLSQ